MVRSKRWRLAANRARERWLAAVIGTARRWPRPLGPLSWLVVAAANLVNALWIGVMAVLLRVPRARLRQRRIEHIFVLVLENRSFDHLLGFATMRRGANGEWQAGEGIDAVTGRATTIDGPNPGRDGVGADTPSHGAPAVMPHDPPHEFTDVRTQLCGPGGEYPHVDMSGFVASYATTGTAEPGTVMHGFAADRVPVISALAGEFAVCDRWFASVPGPTWPNRFFWHAASSAGLDDSPSPERVVTASAVNGYAFGNGTIYDRLDDAGLPWAVYHGDCFPQALAIAGMDEHLATGRFHDLEDFGAHVSRADFAPSYVFIEPDYGHVLPHSTFVGGSSQHPVDGVTGGEKLIKTVYEAIRQSPHWERSLLVIGYDEHGGFYDHVPPPAAVPPDDPIVDPSNNRHGFDFSLLGVRVPAVVVSPLIPRGAIDHVQHDHAAVLATVESLFSLPPLTKRDAAAKDLTHLLSLATPRTDTPLTLPAPPDADALPVPDHDQAPLGPTMAGFVQVALRRHLASAPPGEHDAIKGQCAGIHTHGDATQYLQDVARMVG